jgi:hypothetical protein
MTIDELIDKIINEDLGHKERLTSNSILFHIDNGQNFITFYDSKTKIINHVFQEVEIENSIIKVN